MRLCIKMKKKVHALTAMFNIYEKQWSNLTCISFERLSPNHFACLPLPKTSLKWLILWNLLIQRKDLRIRDKCKYELISITVRLFRMHVKSSMYIITVAISFLSSSFLPFLCVSRTYFYESGETGSFGGICNVSNRKQRFCFIFRCLSVLAMCTWILHKQCQSIQLQLFSWLHWQKL